MKIILSLFIILLSVISCNNNNTSQKISSKSDKIENSHVTISEPKSFPWEIGCDTADTQYEMNVCSLESFQIADSVLQNKYKEILSELEKNYKKENSYEKSSIQIKYLKTLKHEIDEFKKSKLIFENYCENLARIPELQCDGCSSGPYMQNSLLLKLTINQINILDEMYSKD